MIYNLIFGDKRCIFDPKSINHDMETEMTFHHIIPIQIRFSDVDQFGHVNNSVYFSLYDLAKTSYFREVFGEQDWSKFAVVVANIHADFQAPVFFSDDLAIETTVLHLGNKSFSLLQRAVDRKDGSIKCQCRTIMVGYDIASKQPIPIPDNYKQAICAYEGKTIEEFKQQSVDF